MEAGGETRRRGDAAPAVEFPASTEELDFGAEGDIEDQLRGAKIKLLGKFKQRLPAKILAVGGAPDGHIEGFLFDLLEDFEDTEERVGFGFGNGDRFAIGVGLEDCVCRDEREFEGHEVVPFRCG